MSPINTIRILALQDKEKDISLLEKSLKLIGNEYLLEIVHLGNDVINKIESNLYDVLLLDCEIPDANIDDIVNKIKGKNISISVILLAGKELEKYVSDIATKENYDYLIKDENYTVTLQLLIKQVIKAHSIKQENAKLQRKNRDISLLNALSKTIGESLHLETLLNNVLDKILDISELSIGWIILFDEKTNTFSFSVYRGLAEGIFDEKCSVEKNNCFCNSILSLKKTIVSNDISQCSLIMKQPLEVKTCIYVPMRVKDRVIGVICLASRVHKSLSEDDLELADSAGSLIGTAVENARLYRSLELKNQDLLRLNEMKSSFFTMMSYEFRSPLTVISGCAELLNKIFASKHSHFLTGSVQQETNKLLTMISKRANELTSLINNLLNLAKIDIGQLQLQLQKVDMNHLVIEVLLLLKRLSKEKDITVEGIVPENLPLAFIDYGKMLQVFTNLINNAIKFTPVGGKITFTVIMQNQQLEFRITDTGVGIPKDEIEHIFDRFYHIDISDRKRFDRTGLGLAIVKEIVQLHGGKVWVESEINKGSTFAITLPLSFAETPKKKDDTETRTKLRPIPTILLVEDDKDLVDTIETMLGENFKIIPAYDGLEAIKKANEFYIDLILLDLKIPKMNGVLVCNQLKQEPKTSRIPIAILTASGDTNEINKGYEAGADDYILKPFDHDTLVERIRKLIE